MRARCTSRVAGVWLGALALTAVACGAPAVRGEAESGRAAAGSDEAPAEDGVSMETAHDPPREGEGLTRCCMRADDLLVGARCSC